MSKRDWDEKARKLARYVGRQLCEVHRGAVLVTEEVACVFGNDGGDERANREVGYVRRALEDQGVEILGFGEVNEQETWAMPVRTAHVEWLTNVVWVGWNRACGLPSLQPSCSPRAANRVFEGFQGAVAQRAILEVLDEKGCLDLRRKRYY